MKKSFIVFLIFIGFILSFSLGCLSTRIPHYRFIDVKKSDWEDSQKIVKAIEDILTENNIDYAIRNNLFKDTIDICVSLPNYRFAIYLISNA